MMYNLNDDKSSPAVLIYDFKYSYSIAREGLFCKEYLWKSTETEV